MRDNIKIIDLDKGDIDLEAKVISLGNFDGVHLGHQKLMHTNIEISEEEGLSPSVLLFKENSKTLLGLEEDYITSIDDKIDIMADLGIKTFAVLEFSKEFRSLSPVEFIEKILIDKLNTKMIVVGNDYRFGKMAAGNVDLLKSHEDEFGYRTEVVDFEMGGDQKISSKTIRDLIKNGQIQKANEFLSRPYTIRGEVVHGFKRGRELNFPTANLERNFNYAVPTDGVYLTRVDIEGNKHYALTNIGTNPTFEGNDERKIETYILDFNEDIYGKVISIEFLEYFRGDVKFNSVDELVSQMESDKKQAYEVLNKR